MKKKIKDLTLEEAKNVCYKYNVCSECLLYSKEYKQYGLQPCIFDYLIVKASSKEKLEQEIEVEEDEK